MSEFRPTQLANVARGLHAHAAQGREAREAAGYVHRAFLERLDPILGVAGTRALFLRAVKLTARDVSSLRTVALVSASEHPTTSFTTWLRAEAPDNVTRVSVTLFCTLLELLATLIGERLVFQLLKSAWPAFDINAPGEETK